MRVLDGKIGGTYLVKGIELERVIQRRLEMLGMTAGVKLSIVNKKDGGTVILKVRGTRFAVGRQIAAGIRIGSEK